jgi:hypothetical protein
LTKNYVVADELPVFVNYPEIQTGVDFEITPVMYAGAGLILLAVILLVVSSRKKRSKGG